MAEKEMIVAESRVNYEGIFSIDELHKTIYEWLEQKKYDRYDKIHTETVKQDGKYIDIEMVPEKYVTDYLRYHLRIRIYASALKEVLIEQDGRKKRMNNGKVQIVLDAFIVTDYQGRMDSRPLYQVIRMIYDKYIFKGETARNEGKLKADVAHLKETISSYLNLMKHR
jgi:hypothetical protein